MLQTLERKYSSTLIVVNYLYDHSSISPKHARSYWYCVLQWNFNSIVKNKKAWKNMHWKKQDVPTNKYCQ